MSYFPATPQRRREREPNRSFLANHLLTLVPKDDPLPMTPSSSNEGDNDSSVDYPMAPHTSYSMKTLHPRLHQQSFQTHRPHSIYHSFGMSDDDSRAQSEEEGSIMDDVSSRYSSAMGSVVEENPDMSLFASMSARLFKKASIETSQTFLSLDSDSESSTPSRSTFGQWGKMLHTRTKNASSTSLPSVLGESRSIKSNVVSELESPQHFKDSGEYVPSEDESDFLSQSQISLHPSPSPQRSVQSSKGEMIDKENIQNFRQMLPDNALLSSAMHQNEEYDEDLLVKLMDPAPGRSQEPPGRRLRGAMFSPDIKGKRKGSYEEAPIDDQDNEVHGDIDDDDKASLFHCCCSIPMRWRVIGLFVLALAGTTMIAMGSVGKTSWTPGRAEGTLGPVLFPTATPNVMSTPVPTIAPVPPTQNPTALTSSPSPFPTSPPSPFPTIKPPTTRSPTLPTLPPLIWTGTLHGEEDLHDASPEEVHWPHYYSKNGLQIELINTLGDQWQTALQTNIDNWNRISSLDITVSKGYEEEDCLPIWAKVKICNNNYGETGWRGTVQLFLRSGNVVGAAIHLNDYYPLENGWGQYIICHQLGHAFGLSDSEDNDCMKFVDHGITGVFMANRSPGITQEEALREMYGEDNNRRNLRHLQKRSLQQIKKEEQLNLKDGYRVLKFHV